MTFRKHPQITIYIIEAFFARAVAIWRCLILFRKMKQKYIILLFIGRQTIKKIGSGIKQHTQKKITEKKE